MSEFRIKHKDKSSSARTGELKTDHGTIQTPIFMPVGTQATVKGVHQAELEDQVKAEIILANTYHLYLRPGDDIIKKAGGLHKFMSWDKPILTDSGGYQVYSLSGNRKIKEEGAYFQSHIDGSRHMFSPENVMDVQRRLGADIIMAFDECTPYPCDENYARRSLDLTHRWLERCYTHFDKVGPIHDYNQTLVPIAQGSTYPELRKKSCEYISKRENAIYAIGGLSVGEPHHEMYSMTDLCCSHLPTERARYLMGVGLPENVLETIALGIDMFDCVLPSRNARHGLLYTMEGVIHIKNAKWKEEFSPLDPNSTSPSSRRLSKSYVRHLFQVKELLASQVATLHNLCFYLELVRQAREQIEQDNFGPWKDALIPKLRQKL